MNPHEWIDAIERLQRHVDPHLQSAGLNRDWDSYCEYSGHTEFEPHGSSTGWNQVYCPDTEDPDGQPLEEAEEEEEELASKMKKLREIEEQILHKKAALAIKTIGLFTKNTTSPPSVSCGEQTGGTLRDRVRSILLQHPHSFLSQVQDRSPEERRSSSRRQALHPLQLRVRALMKQRCGGLPAGCEQLPDVTQSVPSQAKEETSQHEGFQRFLSVLNKGVDIDRLSRILSDDREDLPLGEEILNAPSSGALQPHHSTETKTDPPSREPNVTERPDAEEKRSEHKARPRSASPQVVRKKSKVEEAHTKVDEQHEQLQNVLKSLGLSLEVEEMSRLADRTQERLYGKKSEGRPRTDSSAEPESERRRSDIEYSRSSSSCSSSSRSSSNSSSRSSSRSGSPSPRDPKPQCERRRPEGQRSGHIAQRLTDQTGSEHTYQHQYLQNQTLPHQHPPASVYPDYSSSQYPCYSSASYNAATYSHWSYTVNPGGHPYPQHVFPGAAVPPNVNYPYPTAFNDIIRTGVHPDLCESEGQTGSASGSRCLTVIDPELLTRQGCQRKPPQNNPQNRKKGLMGAAQQRTPAAGQGKKKKKKKKKKQKKNQLSQQNKEKNKQPNEQKQQLEAKKQQQEVRKQQQEVKEQHQEVRKQQQEVKEQHQEVRKQQQEVKEQHQEVRKQQLEVQKQQLEVQKQQLEVRKQQQEVRKQQLEAKKQPLTEEQIKANLRKKLEAFNQKMKEPSQPPRFGGMQPAHSLASEIS